jgi:phosphoribosylanthranilate isomerase
MLWIKICGLTTNEAVDAAVRTGVDAVGFVFATSKRQISAARAAELSRNVPSHVAKVAVMQHPSQALVDEVCAVFAPDILQADAEDFASLRLPANVQPMPVVREGQVLSTLPARMLYEGKVSGAGAKANWIIARTLAAQTQLVLAGGLSGANVAEAIVAVRPFGVDVSSGVESVPGVKDVTKIEQFVRAARNVDA